MRAIEPTFPSKPLVASGTIHIRVPSANIPKLPTYLTLVDILQPAL